MEEEELEVELTLQTQQNVGAFDTPYGLPYGDLENDDPTGDGDEVEVEKWVSFYVPNPGKSLGIRESNIWIIQNSFGVSAARAEEILDDLEAHYGPQRWRYGFLYFSGDEDVDPVKFSWSTKKVERYMGFKIDSEGKVEGQDERKAAFEALRDDEKSRVQTKINERYFELTGNEEVPKTEDGKFLRSDINQYWQIVDQVLIELGIGPAPEAAKISSADLEAYEAGAAHEEKINKYSGQARMYLEEHREQLKGPEGADHFRIADQLTALSAFHAAYFVEKSKTNVSYDPWEEDWNTILAWATNTSPEEYADAIAHFKKVTDNNRKGAINAATNVMTGKAQMNVNKTWQWVAALTPPDLQVMNTEEKILIWKALTYEDPGYGEASQQSSILTMMTAFTAEEHAIVVDALSENTHKLFLDLADVLVDHRPEFEQILLLYAMNAGDAQQVIASVSGIMLDYGTKGGEDRYNDGTDIFPYASPGLFRQFSDLQREYRVSFNDDGTVYVDALTYYAPLDIIGFNCSEALAVHKKKTYNPYDIVAVEILIPDDAHSVKHQLLFVPAIALKLFEEEQADARLDKWIDAGMILLTVVLTVVTFGQATWAIAAFEIGMAAFMIADTAIQDYRDIISENGGDTFLAIWDGIRVAVYAAGLVFAISQAPKLFQAFKSSWKAISAGVKNKSTAAYKRIEAFMAEILEAEKQADNVADEAKLLGAVDEADAAGGVNPKNAYNVGAADDADDIVKNLDNVDEVATVVNKVDDFGDPVQTIKNKYPDEPLPPDGKLYGKAKVADGNISIDGQLPRDVDFVVDMEGNLLLGKKHHFLGNADDVQAAGTMKISNGKVKRIDNASGHYFPTVEEGLKFEEVFRKLGVNLEGTFMELYTVDAQGNLVIAVTKQL